MEKLIKLVSIRMWYGGPRASLNLKKRDDATWGLLFKGLRLAPCRVARDMKADVTDNP
jgi:hypothetical protein